MERLPVPRNVLPAVRDEDGRRKTPIDDDYLYSRAHYDNALRVDTEMLVGVARELLYRPDEGADPYDTPVIRQRRQEAAKAALDVLWAELAQRNAVMGEPHPRPGLIAFREELRPRRLRRIDPAR
jgi:hypothetical protein